jgi:alpha-L-fucosidase
MRLTRRAVIKGLASLPAAQLMRAQGGRARTIAPGVFRGDWESLRQYRAPDWFRDAKFGIWAHWGPESAPEFGDWYAQRRR